MLTRDEMILALTESANENVASKCVSILKGDTTIEEVRKYCGSFLHAVLNGDYQEAIERADRQNFLCLEIATKKKELRRK